jgi:hypothetical protein
MAQNRWFFSSLRTPPSTVRRDAPPGPSSGHGQPSSDPADAVVRHGQAIGAWALIVAALATVAGCAKSQPPSETPTAPATARTSPPSEAKISAFAVSPENLSVDKISMHEGAPTPDGNRDLVFTATIDGPVDALYLLTCTAKGDPLHYFRADTIIGQEELPAGLGSVVDVGRMTEWIAISENGKFLNHENGKIDLLPGRHVVTLYVPNTGMLRTGTYLRLFGRTTGGELVAGPVVPY